MSGYPGGPILLTHKIDSSKYNYTLNTVKSWHIKFTLPNTIIP
jgi:hypothetical protein